VLRPLSYPVPYTDLQTLVRQRKLKWFGHGHSRFDLFVFTIFSAISIPYIIIIKSHAPLVLLKTILQGTEREGGRRRGRQRKRWEDNIREWTDMELRDTLRVAERCEDWRKVVDKASKAPQRIRNLR